MNLGNSLFNPFALAKCKKLIPYFKHWLHYRISKKFPLIPPPPPPPPPPHPPQTQTNKQNYKQKQQQKKEKINKNIKNT